MKRIAFVVPRYGESILGGAETFARVMAEQVAASNLADVQIFTTCARDHLTWQNEIPEGESLLNGVVVRRFPIDHKYRNAQRYEQLHLRLIRGEMLPVSEQYEWIDESGHSPAMYACLENEGARFDFLIFLPYLFGTTFYGTALHPERSVLWPCLHDEIYAYMSPTREMYRSCLGIMLNTYPESRLANRLYGPHRGAEIVGFGLAAVQGDAERFRQQTGIQSPFILYSGRFEGAKNLPLLINFFLEYKKRRDNSLKLVLMGQGPERIPSNAEIVNIGFNQGQEKLDAYSAARVLCQPSVNESFSIVMMESWLCGAPVLVHADCAVTRYNAAQSNGGLYFRDYDEFEAVLDLILSDGSLRQRLAMNGQQYVQQNYSWTAVLERFEHSLDHWTKLRFL